MTRSLVAGSFAEIVDVRQTGAAVFGTNAVVDATGAQIVAANEGRKLGVIVRATTTGANGIFVGSSAVDCVFKIASATGGNNNETTVFGQGAVYVKAESGTLGVCWQEI